MREGEIRERGERENKILAKSPKPRNKAQKERLITKIMMR